MWTTIALALSSLALASSTSESETLNDAIKKIKATLEKARDDLRASETAHQKTKVKLAAVRRELQKERRERKAEPETLGVKKSTPPKKRTAKTKG